MSTAIPNLFPALDAATEAALRASVERFGVLVPVVRDQHGRTLDGHHRSRIASELGVKFRIDVVRVENDEQAREIAATLNTDRRQLAPEQRREVHAALREQGHSLRAIAGATGVDEKTVRNDLAIADQSAIPERVNRQGGGTYPARRPTVVVAKDEREAARAQATLVAVDGPDGRVFDVKRAERIVRENATEARRNEPVEPITLADDITILHGDFRQVLPVEKFTAAGATIITDPPYPREFLPLWGDLARFGLGWGCDALVAMSGQFLLPEVMEQINSARDPFTGDAWHYRWCGAYLTSGPATRVHVPKVGTSWKPILVFDCAAEREFLTTDVFRSTGDDKDHHHWGQNENGIAALVEAFTKPGDTVVDPFLGGGTTAVVCRALGPALRRLRHRRRRRADHPREARSVSLTEATGWRSGVYSAWHRPNMLRRFLPPHIADDMTMIDIDALLRCDRWIEACRSCYEPRALIETFVDNHQTHKSANATRKLARRAGIEAYLVRYEPNPADTDIVRFHVRRVEAWRDDWVTMTPQQYADFLVRARERGAHTCSCTNAESVVA